MQHQNIGPLPKQIVVGLLAHVDAGKTTLAEALLYRSGAIRVAGRVDHGDAHLDFEQIERTRGITVFAKQARITHDGTLLMLLDTPGHVDFGTEAERVMDVLDVAVLVVSAHAGITGHTKTLWNLLRRYAVPTVVFVNKMDVPGTDEDAVLSMLKERLDAGCVAKRDLVAPDGQEAAALTDEDALDEYLECGQLSPATLRRLVAGRKVFPCVFGSALKMEGIDELLDVLADSAQPPMWPKDFAARVYKVSHGRQGERICWLKVTGGALVAKQVVEGRSLDKEPWSDKVDQLRVYNGNQHEVVREVPAGQVCAVTGLTHARPGDGLGAQDARSAPALAPVLDYKVEAVGCDLRDVYAAACELAQEDPLLGVYWSDELQEVRMRLMGVIQQEVVQQTLRDRYGLDVTFDAGSVLYKETIAAPARGIGHFEPLRHYAEVHVLLEPLARGAGVTCGSACSEDVLARNWQRLIRTHFMEREHRGTLIGAPLTDVCITLTGGRAHPKHTEGGDFRQATYRAIRQGLMQAQGVLLEPWYHYMLEVPQDKVGRAMADLQRMCASLGTPDTHASMAVLEGRVPVATIRDYALEVRAYTRGLGSLSLEFDGYDVCHNAEEVIAAFDYDPASDLVNTPHSVFCSHGAGYTVPWNEVAAHAHVQPIA
jgi:small GTP-binding protein